MKNRFLLPLLVLVFCARSFAQPAPATQPAASVDGTLVTLQMKQVVPEDIFAALGKAAGVRFADNNNLWTQDALQDPIDIDVVNQPFWQVVNDLCSKLNLQPYNNGGQGRGKRISLQLLGNNNQGMKWDAQPSAITHGCLVKATGFNRNQSIQYGVAREPQDVAGVQLMIYIDPALQAATFKYSPKVTEAIDDAGNSMIPQPRKDGMSFGGNGFMQQQSLMVNLQVQLAYPAKPGKKISSLKFNLICRAADGVETLTFDKLDQPQTLSGGDLEITVKGVKPSKNGQGMYDVTVSSRAEDRNDLYNLLQTGQLQDAKGHAFVNNGMNGGGNGGYTLVYAKSHGDDDDTVGPPAKWVIELPTKMKTITMPVELKNLPLP